MVHGAVEARHDAGHPGRVKLRGETREPNIWATTDELWKLAGIEKTDWPSALPGPDPAPPGHRPSL